VFDQEVEFGAWVEERGNEIQERFDGTNRLGWRGGCLDGIPELRQLAIHQHNDVVVVVVVVVVDDVDVDVDVDVPVAIGRSVGVTVFLFFLAAAFVVGLGWRKYGGCFGTAVVRKIAAAVSVQRVDLVFFGAVNGRQGSQCSAALSNHAQGLQLMLEVAVVVVVVVVTIVL